MQRGLGGRSEVGAELGWDSQGPDSGYVVSSDLRPLLKEGRSMVASPELGFAKALYKYRMAPSLSKEREVFMLTGCSPRSSCL